MIRNIDVVENLRGLGRLKRSNFETQSVPSLLVEESIQKGWEILRKNRKSVRLRKDKPKDVLFLDRIWSLLYQMEFTHLSNEEGAEFLIDSTGAPIKLDVVGIDDDIVLAVLCKSFNEDSKWAGFRDEILRFSAIRQKFANSINAQFPGDHKRKIVLAFFLLNVTVSEEEKQAAERGQLVIFDEKDLNYYEKLLTHLGPAAKYQFFADLLPGETVPGLAIKVPAVRTKMRGTYCYSFSISPEYLLKIAYVSHRARGKTSDIQTYQRMLNKSRLRGIKKYISEDGVFPTNIVINLESKRLQFQRSRQEAGDEVDPDNGVLGWLDIRPAYKSAWIIDGQHRLFAYSGHPLATRSRLSILAFEGLSPSEQARLFIDINAKQKSVKQSLLQELYSELHWNSESPEIRTRAIISRAIQTLDEDTDSPLYQRIQAADDQKDDIRCITLNSLYSAVERNRFHIAKEKQGNVIEFGPLWAGTNDATVKRTVYILKNWFEVISSADTSWWNKGAGEGGGLAMNDSVVALMDVLGSIFQHLQDQGKFFSKLDNKSLFVEIKKYAEITGEYLSSLTEEGRRQYRSLRGREGQVARTRRCQQWIRNQSPSFNPAGLDAFLHNEMKETNKRAKEIIDRIENGLQEFVVEELRREYGKGEEGWWMEGVPYETRTFVSSRYEEDKGKRGGKEFYFDLIHYKKIIEWNWPKFTELLGKNKDKATSWIAKVNDIRKLVAHSSSGQSISTEQLSQLESYEQWFFEKIKGINENND